MNILIAIFIFGLVVIFHELGHFLLAKKNGITVTEFSVGMGPRLASFVRNGTRYSIKLLPLGGSCMMLGEDEDLKIDKSGEEEKEKDPNYDENSFNSKSVWARISVIAGGPIFNFILAFLLSLIIIGMIGYDSPKITNISENGPAQEAGLQVGDVITSINGSSIHFGREVMMYFTFHTITPGDTLEIKYKRDGKKYTANLVTEQKRTYQLGLSYMANEAAATIEEIVKGGALDKVGVQKGDTIIAINDTKIRTGKELSVYFTQNAMDGSAVKVTYLRNELEYNTEVVPIPKDSYNIGFSYNLNSEKTDPLSVIKYSFYEVKYWISSTIQSLGMMFRGKVSTEDLGGPVRIVSEIGKVVDTSKEYGIKNLLIQLMNWTVLLSANLGVMNLLPIPALDGGRLVFLIIEAVRGKPIDREKEAYVHMAGFVLLMLLMVFVFYNDLKNVFF